MEIEYSEEEDVYFAHIELYSLNEFEKTSKPKELMTVDFFSLGNKPSNEQMNALNYLLDNEKEVFKSLIQ